MNFPQDGGISCVRYYLVPREPGLEALAQQSLRSPGRHVGSLVCQCGENNNWGVGRSPQGQSVYLVCQCNASALPIYIGEKATIHPNAEVTIGEHPCNGGGMKVAIAIGYPGEVPPLGNIEVERAQEIAIAAQCLECQQSYLFWHLLLKEPPTFRGDEPWLKKIQGYKERSFWQKLPPREKAKHPDTPPGNLFHLASEFPAETLENPVLPMVALESPLLWERINYQARTAQYRELIKSSVRALSEEARRRWKIDCSLRALSKFALSLTAEETRAQAERCRESLQREAFTEKRGTNKHHEQANESWRLSQDQRRPLEERNKLYTTAATERVLYMIEEASQLYDFIESAVDAASYIASASGTSPEKASLDEYQWMLSAAEAT